MIDLRAMSEEREDGKGTHITCHMEGSGVELLNETLAVIQSLMGQLKQNTPLMHLMAVKTIADEPMILFGKDFDEKEVDYSALADMMSDSIIKKGVN